MNTTGVPHVTSRSICIYIHIKQFILSNMGSGGQFAKNDCAIVYTVVVFVNNHCMYSECSHHRIQFFL